VVGLLVAVLLELGDLVAALLDLGDPVVVDRRGEAVMIRDEIAGAAMNRTIPIAVRKPR
jgi:hypothetical protein